MKIYKKTLLAATLLISTPAFAIVNCGALAAHMAMHLKIEIEGRDANELVPKKGQTLVSIAESIVTRTFSKSREEMMRNSPELFQWATFIALDQLRTPANFNSDDFVNRTQEKCLGRFYR